MLDPDRTLLLATRVASVADGLGISTALIGAAALAVHGYARGTEDLDLGTYVRPFDQLEAFAKALREAGMAIELRLPDDEDPLGGVLVVRETGEGAQACDDIVEIVNFLNPANLTTTPAVQAISRAIAIEDLGLKCVTLPDLIALKLYAGGSADLADIVQLVARNPDADLHEIRAVAGPFDEHGRLCALIEEALQLADTRKA